MFPFRSRIVPAMLGLVLCVIGCGDNPGRKHRYNYSPTVIQSGNLRQIWWCGQAVNPADKSQDTDAILYEAIDLKTNVTTTPVTVLAETPGAWDSVFTCNPKVIKGTFVNPLEDGKTYSYAMYYVATADKNGHENCIGVAFSNDGISWNKYPHPVVMATSPAGYGAAQPAIYNSNGKAAIWMFYESDDPIEHHIVATSPDGLHFTIEGTLTTVGLNSDTVLSSWGDMAYDSATGYWYSLFNGPLRDPSTTGGVPERGQLGVELYRIPGSSLLTGATPWQELHTFDTNLTTSEANFIGGFVRNQFGTVNVGKYPTIQMEVSISNPPPDWNATPKEAAESAHPTNWQLGLVEWVPNHPLMALDRYTNSTTHIVTTGWINPASGFNMEMTLGHLYESPQQGATVAFYGCKRGSTDYFVSLDHSCEGERILGKNGYGYALPVAGRKLVPLYRCSTGTDHFVSKDSKCEGATTDQLLGYAMP
jgi:hypothetical protein